MTDRPTRLEFGSAAILGACLCVSVASIMTKALLAHAPVLPVVFAQVLASTVVVWAVAAARGRLPRGRTGLRLATPGLLAPGLQYLAAYGGLAMTPVSIEGVLFALEATLVALLAWPLLRERPSRQTRVSIALGTVGVVLISWRDTGDARIPLAGVALILAGVACGALDTLVSRVLAPEADPLTMTAAVHAAGLAVVAATVLGTGAATGAASWTFLRAPGTLAVVVVSGVLLHGVATLGFVAALQHTTAARAAALFPSIAVFNTLGGYVVLGERLWGVQLGGGVLVVAAALLVARPARDSA